MLTKAGFCEKKYSKNSNICEIYITILTTNIFLFIPMLAKLNYQPLLQS